MSRGRELSDYLDDIITAIADTAEFTQDMTYEMFAADKKRTDIPSAASRWVQRTGRMNSTVPSVMKNIHFYEHKVSACPERDFAKLFFA